MKLFLLAVTLLGSSLTSAAELDDTAVAKTHYELGKKFYKAARFKEAIGEFETAYRLRPHGVIFYNLAKCHEGLGDLGAALTAYREYLKQVPKAEDRASVEASIASLEARLGSNTGKVAIRTEPAGAAVSIDGTARGSTPVDMELPVGAHKLTLALPGYQPLTRDLAISREKAVELDLSLKQEAALVVTPHLDDSIALLPPPPLPGAQTSTEAAAEPRRLWTWIALGTAGAALAGGVVAGLAARSASADLLGLQHDRATADGLASSASGRATLANVLYVAGGVAGAAGVTLFFVEGRF